MLTEQPADSAFPSAWPEMLSKMEGTLQRLLAEEGRDASLPATTVGPGATFSPKQTRLLQRLDKHLGNLEACMGRAEGVAREGALALDEAISDLERWLGAVLEAEKKLATAAGNPVG
ncbi:MAG: hypothetical protein ACJ8FY_04655 [Gemmataceae bacterium]